MVQSIVALCQHAALLARGTSKPCQEVLSCKSFNHFVLLLLPSYCVPSLSPPFVPPPTTCQHRFPSLEHFLVAANPSSLPYNIPLSSRRISPTACFQSPACPFPLTTLPPTNLSFSLPLTIFSFPSSILQSFLSSFFYLYLFSFLNSSLSHPPSHPCIYPSFPFFSPSLLSLLCFSLSCFLC